MSGYRLGNMTNGRTVVILNLASGTGHHESWTALFTRLLLDRGLNVICMTPRSEVVQRILRRKMDVDLSPLCILTPPVPEPRPATLSQRLSILWAHTVAFMDVLLGTPVLDLPAEGPSPQELSFGARVRQGILWGFVNVIWVAQRVAHNIVAKVVFRPIQFVSGLWGRRDDRGCVHPSVLSADMHRAMERSPWKPDFLFCMYQDSWLTAASTWRCLKPLPLPWAGLYFDSPETLTGEEGWFTHSTFEGLCFVDNSAPQVVSRKIPGYAYSFLPDVADASLPDKETVLVQAMKTRAKNRGIVVLCGSIESRKNIARFCRLAVNADPRKWFFAIVGAQATPTLSCADKVELNRFLLQENCHLVNGFFPDEEELNAVIAISSVIFAVYLNFRKSSNMLGKAAHFEKPILVSDRYLMGEQVRRYGIGLAVAENDTQAMLEGLEYLARHPIPSGNFAEYRKDFSEEALGAALKGFIEDCLRTDT